MNQAKEKNKAYSPYYTNINSLETNQYSKTNKNTSNIIQSKRVLSTIQKLISKKISRVTPNIKSVFQINSNDNNNNSLKPMQNNRYGTDISNHDNMPKKQKKINSKLNTSSQNKISDFITPLKKKYFYYYH
jgi:hypothetical protein